jgi:hypothetical protein
MIKCRIKENTPCLKCGAIEKEMILIGAFVMCKECWKKEFLGLEEFGTGSELYVKKYLKWYKKYEKLIN